ncbi:MAG: trypsin-like peptidase domain-containing protein [Myxococcales bacterium]|nr:trypsin-like peptidase domain-containing protein [Myxococcales bacterium]MCB9547979.1 trypsin-like peptidase domain-containing protein [Myxococcales bacterium]
MRASRLPAGVVFEERPGVVELPEQEPVELPGALAAACAATPRAFGTPIPCAEGPAAALAAAVQESVVVFNLPFDPQSQSIGLYSGFFIGDGLLLTVAHAMKDESGDLKPSGLGFGRLSADGRQRLNAGPNFVSGWTGGAPGSPVGDPYDVFGWTDYALAGEPTFFENLGHPAWVLDQPVAQDYSVWRVSSPAAAPPIELRTFGSGGGDWVYMVGHGTDEAANQYPMEISRSRLKGPHVGGFPRNFGGFLEARVNSVPSCSGAPWLDVDGCAVGVNKEGYRGFRREEPEWSWLNEDVGESLAQGPIDARRDSWATPMLNIASNSPNVRAAIGRNAPRALSSRPWLFDAGTMEWLCFRDEESGHLIGLSSYRYQAGDPALHGWAQFDMTVLHGAAPPAPRASMSGWTNDRGVTYVAYLSTVAGPGPVRCGLPALQPRLLYSRNGRQWQAVVPDIQALLGPLVSTHGDAAVSLRPEFFVAWYRPASRTAHMILGDTTGAVYHLNSTGNDTWSARLVTRGADTSAQGARALAGWARGNLCCVILRMTENVVAHFEWRNEDWVRRGNTSVPRGADRVAVSVVVIPAELNNGLASERAYASYRSGGTEHILEMQYHEGTHQWQATAQDLQSVGEPIASRSPQRSISASLQVLDSADGQRGARPEYVIRVAYVTQVKRNTAAVVRFSSRLGRWEQDEVRTSTGANIQVTQIGRTGNGRICIAGGDGRLDWVVPMMTYGGSGVLRRYCLSDRTGMPLGWCYEPGSRPRPRSQANRRRRGPCVS